MNHFAITIGRQLGSGGKPVGEIVARRLGVRIYDRSLVDLAARSSGLAAELFARADEHGAKGRFAALVGYMRAPCTGYEGGNAANMLSNEALFQMQSDAIREVAARESCLFVGRCADYILRDHPRAASIFVAADAEDRVERLCRRDACTEQQARLRIERVDACRASYYNYYSGRTWGEAATYDLCINSSRLGIEATADLVLEFAARKLGLKL